MFDSDRDIKNWDQRLQDQAGKGWDNYKVIRVDLTQARTNEQLRKPGEFLIVSDSSSAAAVATVKFNRTTNPSLDLAEDVEIKSLFTVLFISNEALADQWIDLIIGINFEYKKKIVEIGLPKTGQAIEYAAGDDGTYEAGWVLGRLNANNRTRFTAHTIAGDDVVLDRATGLMWAADGNEAGCNNGAVISWANSITYANGLDFAGFTDWRSPNAIELFSLLDFVEQAAPKIDHDFFPNTVNDYYWAGTTQGFATQNGYVVHFQSMLSQFKLKIDTYYLRCVRKRV